MAGGMLCWAAAVYIVNPLSPRGNTPAAVLPVTASHGVTSLRYPAWLFFLLGKATLRPLRQAVAAARTAAGSYGQLQGRGGILAGTAGCQVDFG